jgi:thiol:disulfide interchange protein DsbD
MRSSIALLLLACLAAPTLAQARQSARQITSHTTAALISETDTYKPGQPLRIGLQLTIAPGWHTYWLNPGDAGAPPTLDVSGDVTGAQAGPIAYPTPTREQDGPFTSFVYQNRVLLPVTVTPSAQATGPLRLQAHASWLVCEKLCVPEEGDFAVVLPPGDGVPGVDAAAFAATDAASPRPSPFPAHVAADGSLRLEAPGVRPVSVYVFPNESGVIDQGAAQRFESDADGVTIHLKPLSKASLSKPFAGVVTLTDQAERTESLRFEATTSGAPPVAPPALPGLIDALVLAFLGGLVLNLMPCVMPVLAMKALALARLSGAARSRIRHESLLYTAGVLVAFAAIGGVTLAVGAAGGSAGWGVQFQSAAFSAGMALLMLAVALNFSGVFEVGAGFAGFGQSLAQRGSFFTGLLAVVVATPCTAPFMATALAAAVALPPTEGMAIFLALGMGLAAPYAMLAVFPGAARLLPRPGAWMERLKHALALPMYAAAAFLAWVVWHAAGTLGLLAVLAAGGLLIVAGLIWGRHQRGVASSTHRAGGLGAFATAGLIVALLALHAPAPPPMTLAAGSEPFSQARLDALRAAHRPVLVDMSAAWCITCLVNERVALAPAPVRAAFAQHGVAYLVGDWTRQDPGITAFLRQYGRNGVPLYVYFPAQGAPQVLPQILTQAAVLAQIGA